MYYAFFLKKGNLFFLGRIVFPPLIVFKSIAEGRSCEEPTEAERGRVCLIILPSTRSEINNSKGVLFTPKEKNKRRIAKGTEN